MRLAVPTRLLLTCAAIGAAAGLLLVPAFVLSTTVAPAIPLLYAAFAGIWSIPFVVALALLRQPGVALLTSLIAGLINAVLTPQGPSAILTCLMIGAMVEIPIAIGLYRSFRPWIFYVGAGAFALPYALYSMPFLGVDRFPLWAQIAYPTLSVLSNLAGVWLGLLIADRLERTGVARGLQRPVRRIRATDAAAQAPVAGTTDAAGPTTGSDADPVTQADPA